MKTQKLIPVIVSLFSMNISMPALAQTSAGPTSDAFDKGSNIINLGLGLGGYYTYNGPNYSSTPNFVLSYDNGTFGNVGPGTISLGALLSFKGISYDYTNYNSGYYYNQSWTYYILGLRSAYHLTIPSCPKFDPYAGIMLGYYDIGYKVSSNDPEFNVPGNPYYFYYVNNYSNYLALSFYLGARYYVSNKVGLWLELGYGYTDAALGVCFKM
jgi:hypothetical protein